MKFALKSNGAIGRERFSTIDAAIEYATLNRAFLRVERSVDRVLIVEPLIRDVSQIRYEVVPAPPNPPLLSARRALPL